MEQAYDEIKLAQLEHPDCMHINKAAMYVMQQIDLHSPPYLTIDKKNKMSGTLCHGFIEEIWTMYQTCLQPVTDRLMKSTKERDKSSFDLSEFKDVKLLQVVYFPTACKDHVLLRVKVMKPRATTITIVFIKPGNKLKTVIKETLSGLNTRDVMERFGRAVITQMGDPWMRTLFESTVCIPPFDVLVGSKGIRFIDQTLSLTRSFHILETPKLK